jgi:hypothetical protein
MNAKMQLAQQQSTIVMKLKSKLIVVKVKLH